LLSALMITLLSNASAQREVSGRVTDSRDGSALPGASVRVKGKSTGTSTGADGRFSIQAAASETLVFSNIGFIEKEIRATDASIDVVLDFADQPSLREVVVTGYTVQSRREATASIGKV